MNICMIYTVKYKQAANTDHYFLRDLTKIQF